MQNIEEEAIDTYKKNLIYFEKSQKNIYDKLSDFESAVELGHYKINYDLLIKDDYFDVLEMSSSNYLYGSDSNEYANKASRSIDFKKNTNVFECFKKIDIKHEDLKKYEQVDIIKNNLSGFAPILDYIYTNQIQNSDLKTINKFIFFGVGLGRHIISIDKIIHAQTYFIIEDDLELFKLSLFTTPYYEIAKNAKLIFSVFDSKQEFYYPATEFLDTDFMHNHYIKYFHMLSHSEEKLEQFHIKTTSLSHNLFYYNAILEQYLRPITYLKDGYNFLNLLKNYKDCALENLPVLIIAPGPSLKKNIEWLRLNHDRFILVAFSASLSILEDEGISPDIVTHLDGLKESQVHFEKLKSYDFLKNSSFVISARTQVEIIKKLKKENIFLFENGTSYKDDFANLSAPCVGATSYLLFLSFGVKNLYLLGLDLALDSITGATHANGHTYAQDLNIKNSNVDEDTLVFKDTVLRASGNFQKTVYTTPNFLLSINSIDASSIGFKKDYQNVYNLNDGAAFKNTISQRASNINMSIFNKIDKKVLKEQLLKNFTSNSSNKVTKNELIKINKRLDEALKTKRTILEQENLTFFIYEDYLNSLLSLMQELTSNKSGFSHDLALVYQEYFRLITTFIFDFFNSLELEDKCAHANTINKLLCTQLLRIVDTYIQKLDKQ
ncbi:MAG: hypothetical protein COB17_08325 [Sulfurimonas sp.]|nr:MAG: hypothetical protein COB17_08325 [Sulfurimonas sp.]